MLWETHGFGRAVAEGRHGADSGRGSLSWACRPGGPGRVVPEEQQDPCG